MSEQKSISKAFMPLVYICIGVLATYLFLTQLQTTQSTENVPEATYRDSIIVDVDVPMGKGGASFTSENWCNCTWETPTTPSALNCPIERGFNWSGSTASADIRKITITRPGVCGGAAQAVTFILRNDGATVEYFIGNDFPTWTCLSSNNFCLTSDGQLTYDDATSGMAFLVEASANGNGTDQKIRIQCSSTYQISVSKRGSCGVGG